VAKLGLPSVRHGDCALTLRRRPGARRRRQNRPSQIIDDGRTPVRSRPVYTSGDYRR
jgi:hypothetical protein